MRGKPYYFREDREEELVESVYYRSHNDKLMYIYMFFGGWGGEKQKAFTIIELINGDEL